MKSWKRPVATAQAFTANDYVSACIEPVTIKCDFSTGESLHGGGLVIPDGVDGDFANSEYRPCKHEFVIDVDQLKQCTFTHFAESMDNVPLSKEYEACYWIQSDEHDFHATSIEAANKAIAAAESNKS